MPPRPKTVYRDAIPWWKKKWDQLLYLLILVVFFLFYPGQNLYTVGTYLGKPSIKRLKIGEFTPAPYPINQTGIYPGAEITAGGIVIQDVNSGVYLFRRNAEGKFFPASTTKIMTALTALDVYDLDEVITVKNPANSGQVINLIPGERLTVENLLFGALVASGNDAAYALAENYPGGVDRFVEAMNQKAKDINLTNTRFTNPVGYDDADQLITPQDLATLGKVALDHPVIAKIVAIPQITISDVTHTYFHSLTNINQLLGKIPGVGGIKTGWTEEAGENLITLVERAEHKVIIVVLKSQDRFSDTAKLIDWIFDNYRWEVVVLQNR